MIKNIVFLDDRNSSKVTETIYENYIIYNEPRKRQPKDAECSYTQNGIKMKSRHITFTIANNKVFISSTSLQIAPNPELKHFVINDIDQQCLLDTYLNKLKNKSSYPYEIFYTHYLYYFVILIFKLTKFTISKYILLKLPTLAVTYIIDQPMGLKQNTIIKITLGKLCNFVINAQSIPLKINDPVLILLELYTVPTSLCISIVFTLYHYITVSLINLAQLFRSKTYNPLKNRYDTIVLSTEQIILAVMIFAFFFLIFTNLISFYLFYLMMYLILAVLDFCKDFVHYLFFMPCRTSSFHRLQIEEGNIKLLAYRINYSAKINFALEAAYITSVFNSEHFWYNFFVGGLPLFYRSLG